MVKFGFKKINQKFIILLAIVFLMSGVFAFKIFKTKAMMLVQDVELFGKVIDAQTQQALPDVELKLVNISFGDICATTTDSAGNYNFHILGYTNFTLIANLDGYQEKIIFDINVSFDDIVELNIELEPESGMDPVIIVPGIMGSWNVSGEWQLDPILHTYDNLWEALKLAGYEENKTLFAFPYQWRLSNSYTAVLLQEEIRKIKEDICECDKVDIVAHSMGGLVARSYIQSNDYQNDVDQLIFLGTPHQGSTRAYLAWEGGEFGVKPIDKIQQRIFTVEADFNGYGSVFKYVRGLPMQSIQEMLPIYDYLRDKDTMQLRIYPNNYPVNIFLDQLNNPIQLEKLNSINITNILANAGNDSTINNLRVIEKEFFNGEWEHGYPENYSLPFTDHGLEYGAGDGTVPERSNKDFLGLENVIIDNSSHNDMATDAQKTVIKELTGVEPTEEVRKNIFSKFFLIRIFSPADFTVIAPDNKKIGKNIGGSEIIPGAFYSGFDSDIEFAVIPDPINGEYKIELEGTGEGEYKLSASFIDDEQDIDKEFFGNIQQGQIQSFDFAYEAEAEDPISELIPEDNVLPVITINNPTENEQYLHNENLIIDYTATDDFSGIANIIINLDNQVLSTTAIDLFYYNVGEHILNITAADNAGNIAIAEVKFETIANIDSTIQDIEKMYGLNWISKKSVKQVLIVKLEVLQKRLDVFVKQKETIEKLKQTISDNTKIKEDNKQKLLDQFDNRLLKLEQQEDEFIEKSLANLEKDLSKFYSKEMINQQGYDIIISDINYLKNNL